MDRLMSSLGFGGGGVSVGVGMGVGGKGHSDSSTLSSQPSIDEVRQQMHLLLDNAFGLTPAEPSAVVATSSSSSAAAAAVAVAAKGHPHLRHHHHHSQHSSYAAHHTSPYSDGVTSAPGTMNHPAPPLQRGSSFEPDMHQCSLPKPVRIFTVTYLTPF